MKSGDISRFRFRNGNAKSIPPDFLLTFAFVMNMLHMPHNSRHTYENTLKIPEIIICFSLWFRNPTAKKKKKKLNPLILFSTIISVSVMMVTKEKSNAKVTLGAEPRGSKK